MKKNYFFTLLLALICNTIFSQVLNGSFESWKAYPDDQGLNLWRPPQPQNTITGEGEKFDLYKQQPCFVWTGDWNPAPQNIIAGYVSQAAGKVLPLCVYGYPRNNYSSGGFKTLADYKKWIDAISAGLGAAPCILVLEPDALGLHSNMPDGTTPETALFYAVNKFENSNSKTDVYIDASHWVNPVTQSARLRGAGLTIATGFVTNVSNFHATSEMLNYCESLNLQLEKDGVGTKKYIIDTGRNGNGELTNSFGADAQPWLSRNEGWLNPPGRGLGLSPRANPYPSKPNFFATMWVKPPGKSDGHNPGSTWFSDYFSSPAPEAGSFWLEWMKDCLEHTDMSNLK